MEIMHDVSGSNIADLQTKARTKSSAELSADGSLQVSEWNVDKPGGMPPKQALSHDALQNADDVLDESRNSHLELYEFAPAGYLTLTEKALISEASLNGIALLGDERDHLLNRRFARFVAPADRDRWRRNFLNVIRNGGRQSIELTLRRRNGSHFQALLNCLRLDAAPDVPKVQVALIDITDVAELRRIVADTKIAAIVFESQEAMVIADANNVILRVNRAFTDISGYSEQEVAGRTMNLLKSDRHEPLFYSAMWERIRSTGSWQGEIWNKRKNGEIFPALVTITAVKRSDGAMTHYVGSMIDITQRKAAEDEIQNLAFYDPLTGLPNRRLLLDRLNQALAASGRSRREGALLFIDLDDFKTLNDTLGHDVGDLLLTQVAQRLTACVREGDTVARLGGDEFVVIFENLEEGQQEAAIQVEHIGEKILESLNRPYIIGNYERHITASIGVTLFSDHQRTVEELMKRADLAMYQAKAAGRNTLRFFDREMQAIVTTRAMLEIDLRSALLKREFILYFQPQVNAEGGITGSEALVRWQNPMQGLVSPLEFIAAAEQTGLILPLGQWVLESACTQLVNWAANEKSAHLHLAVNVSARQFRELDFVDQVLELLERTGADPLKLKLELTESVLLDDVEDTIAKMSALKNRGVSFSLDDFGLGYSSLSYLKRLPLDQLKIDKSFIRNVLTDPNDSAIAKMVVALGQSMNLNVIAEGVETEGQRDFLAHHGCSDYQGYLFSPPLPQEAFEEMLYSSEMCLARGHAGMPRGGEWLR